MIEFTVVARVGERPTEFRGLGVGECFVEASLAEGTEGFKHRGIWVKNGAFTARHLDSPGASATVKLQQTSLVYRVKWVVEVQPAEERE